MVCADSTGACQGFRLTKRFVFTAGQTPAEKRRQMRLETRRFLRVWMADQGCPMSLVVARGVGVEYDNPDPD